jgi:hypothetical protein
VLNIMLFLGKISAWNIDKRLLCVVGYQEIQVLQGRIIVKKEVTEHPNWKPNPRALVFTDNEKDERVKDFINTERTNIFLFNSCPTPYTLKSCK